MGSATLDELFSWLRNGSGAKEERSKIFVSSLVSAMAAGEKSEIITPIFEREKEFIQDLEFDDLMDFLIVRGRTNNVNYTITDKEIFKQVIETAKKSSRGLINEISRGPREYRILESNFFKYLVASSLVEHDFDYLDGILKEIGFKATDIRLNQYLVAKRPEDHGFPLKGVFFDGQYGSIGINRLLVLNYSAQLEDYLASVGMMPPDEYVVASMRKEFDASHLAGAEFQSVNNLIDNVRVINERFDLYEKSILKRVIVDTAKIQAIDQLQPDKLRHKL